MRYVGGKAKLGSWLTEEILKLRTNQDVLLEPFVGGGNSFVRLAKHFSRILASDLHADVVMLFSAIGKGWQPPFISKELYKELKNTPPSALRGFAGFGCSFGGKWFGGYTHDAWDEHHKKRMKPFQEAAIQSLLQHREVFARTSFAIGPYNIWQPKKNMLVYCDPPYRDTLGYGTKFNHEQFWDTMREWRRNGVLVVVSEAQAPEDWQVIAEKSRKSLLRVARGTENTTRIERLFV
jgi:DNA adenine methylase